jgi:hypothetical protein
MEYKEDYVEEDYPGITIVNKRRLKLKTAPDWQNPKSKIHNISIKDVVTYFKTQANSMSGFREIGDIQGDWREIDAIAQDCLEVFKRINIKGLRSEAKRQKIQPKF